MSENSTAMKLNRSYERLLCAIIEEKPKNIIDDFLFEYCGCDSKYRGLMKMSFEEYQAKIFLDAKEEAKKYFSHRQNGRSVIVLKSSPLGRKLAKGMFSSGNEE